MSQALSLPFRGVFPVSQSYGNGQNDAEPLGYRYPDGSIRYVAGAGATLGHWHNGIDYALPCGTPIYAPADGTVYAAGLSSTGFGLRLMLKHSECVTLYGHLTRILVPAVGATVKAGQLVAYSGGGNGDARDGDSTGCHLHFSVMAPDATTYLDPNVFLPAGQSGAASSVVPDPVHSVPFSVTVAARDVYPWDGPSNQLRELGGPFPPNTVLACDAWMYGQPRYDQAAGRIDRRWYHCRQGWVPSARVTGNAPDSAP